MRLQWKLPLRCPSLSQITGLELKLPKIVAIYETIRIPVYLPRFVEIPLPGDAVDDAFRQSCDKICDEVAQLAQAAQVQSVSLCKIESVGVDAKQWSDKLTGALTVGVRSQNLRLLENWKNDKFQIRHDNSIGSLSTNDELSEGETVDADEIQLSGRAEESIRLRDQSRRGRELISSRDRFSTRNSRTRQEPALLHAYSPIRGFVTAASNFRAPLAKPTDGSTTARSLSTSVTSNSTSRQVEWKVYRNRHGKPARRDVGGNVVESNEHIEEFVFETAKRRTSSSKSIPMSSRDPTVSFGMNSCDSTHLDDTATNADTDESILMARSPLH